MRLRTSPAAEFQSIQTRAKMGAALWSQTLGTVFFVWIVLTLWVIWHRVGHYRPGLHHQFFGRWILCSILTNIPFVNRLAATLPMYANGAWYKLPEFGHWLDNVYGASFYGWFWSATTGAGAYGLGSDLLPIAAGGLLLAWWWHRDPDRGNHIRGLTLMTAREFDRAIWREP
jgi:hypothetical protein